jgi:hypothetical protein
MARYFTLASTRGKGIAKMMEKAKAEPGHPITLYAAAGTGPTYRPGCSRSSHSSPTLAPSRSCQRTSVRA